MPMYHVFQYPFSLFTAQECLNCGERVTVDEFAKYHRLGGEQCPGRQHALPDNTPEDDWQKDRRMSNETSNAKYNATELPCRSVNHHSACACREAAFRELREAA